MWDVVLDAVLDTLKLFPFLLILYVLIELLEHNTSVGKPRKALAGRGAPALGSALGLVPMCGFSVMAAKLYEHRHITLGTLVAVFTATSDEGLLVLLLSSGMGWERVFSALALIGCKFVLGVLAGYALDGLFRKHALSPLPESGHAHHVREEGHREEGHSEEEHGEEEHEHGACGCAELSPCEHKKKSAVTLYFFSPLLHALEVAAFVLAVNLAFGMLFYWLGEARVISFMQGGGYWLQPLVCALVGAIPNCASSVVLAEVYALGGIGFGGLLGGLVVNAGLGYLILLKKRTWKEGLALLSGMIVFSVAVGYAANGLALLI